MKSDELHRYLSEAANRLPAASGKNLSAMLFDCAYVVEASKLFTKIEATITENPHCLVEVRCKSRSSSEEVASEVEKLWNEGLRYQRELEAHCVTTEEREVVLSGVTEIAGLHYVTLQTVVTLL